VWSSEGTERRSKLFCLIFYDPVRLDDAGVNSPTTL
jgi:hypothetical protein